MHVATLTSRGWAFTLVFCLSIFPACAAQADAVVDQATLLLQQGEDTRAFQWLDAHEEQRAGDPAFDALMGRAARAVGQYTRAVLAWERVVAVQPDNLAARQELVRALYAAGDKRSAQLFSSAGRGQGAPADAALDIDQFLTSYDQPGHGGESSFRGYAELTMGYDSNANAGPRLANLVSPLPGTPAWTLAPSALDTSAGFGAALVGVRGRHVVDARWSLVGAATVGSRHHSGAADRLDSLQIDGSAGVAWRSERHEIVVSGVGAHYAQDGSRLRGIAGVQGEWIYRMDGFHHWSGFAQRFNLHYPAQTQRDVQRSVVGVSYAQVLRNGAQAYGMVYAGTETPDAAGFDHFGHRLVGWRVGGHYPLASRMGVFAALDWEQRRYGADDPFFAVRRRDHQTSLALGLSWAPTPHWRITPQLQLVHNASTLPTTRYERRVFSVTLRREF